MLTFGRLMGEEAGFSVITFLRKIITYSPDIFSDSSPLVLYFRVVSCELREIYRSDRGKVCLKLHVFLLVIFLQTIETIAS